MNPFKDGGLPKPCEYVVSKKYAAMTVNERLYVSGLMDEFEGAVEERDLDRICAILRKVELAEDSLKPILEQLEF